MTGQNDRQDRSLTGQVRDQAGHCPLTGRYLQPWLNSILTEMELFFSMLDMGSNLHFIIPGQSVPAVITGCFLYICEIG